MSRVGCYDIRNVRYFDPLPNSQGLMDLPSTTPFICDSCHLNIVCVVSVKIALHIDYEKSFHVNQVNVTNIAIFTSSDEWAIKSVMNGF
ncbi:conserved hypothetical protein [Vibrio diabolicus]|nr:conserved hypothetical protein [Vibrio diabolicus]